MKRFILEYDAYSATKRRHYDLLGEWPICMASLSNDATSAELMSSWSAANNHKTSSLINVL